MERWLLNCKIGGRQCGRISCFLGMNPEGECNICPLELAHRNHQAI